MRPEFFEAVIALELKQSRRRRLADARMCAVDRPSGLTKDYTVGFWRPRPYRALDGLDAAGRPGEVFGFLGPNGAGKTTTLKLLMQLIYPDVAARPGFSAGRSAIRTSSAGIGYLPEQPVFLRLPHRGGTARRTSRRLFGYRAGGAPGARRRGCSTRSASAPSAGCSCASSRRACCSASASRRRSSTSRRWSSSTSRCPGSIRWAGASPRT